MTVRYLCLSIIIAGLCLVGLITPENDPDRLVVGPGRVYCLKTDCVGRQSPLRLPSTYG